MSRRPAVGIIDLRDLAAYPWSSLHLPKLLADAGLSPGPERWRSWRPPDKLVVIAPMLRPDLVEMRISWLSAARAILLVLDPEGDLPEEDLRALIEAEWQERAARIGCVRSIFQLDPSIPSWLSVLVDRALDLPAESSEPTEPLAPPSLPSYPRGPWIPVDGPLEPADLAPRLCVPGSGPALLGEGQLRDLASPTGAPLGRQRPWEAISPDGTRLFDGSGALTTLSREPLHASLGRVGWPTLLDPWHPLGIAGFRCVFHWYYWPGDAIAELCVSSHGWPCGHAKKLWGFKDNCPVTVTVAPDTSAYVSTFEHDALVSSDVPLRWALRGDLAIALPPASVDDPLRALFFCTGDIPAPPGDPLDASDDDQRAFAPPVVLGPGGDCRYAVALHTPTYRIRGETSERIDDGTESYAIFDSQHRATRRGEGRLLGGWFQHVTLLARGSLWREDLATGARELLAPADREIAWALPVPGTRNILLATEGAIRLL